MQPPSLNKPPSSLARFLRSVDPDEVLGAVFQREIRASARRISVILSRGVYILLLAGAAWIAYAIFEDENSGPAAPGQGGGPAQRLQSMQQLAPILTIVVTATQAVLLALIAPSTTAGSLCEERKKRTLDVLLTTPLKPRQIVLGKLAAGLASLLILCLASLPLLLAIRVFGGVDAKWILCATAITLTTALVGASAALMCSVFVKRAATASFFAVIIVGAAIVVPLLIAYTRAPRSGPTGGLLDLLTCSPPVAMSLVCSQMMDVPVPLGDPVRATIIACLYNTALSALALTLATSLLRKVMLATGAGSAPAATETVEETTDEPVTEFPPTEEGADQPAPRTVKRTVRVTRGTSREVGDQPILWRELRQPLFKRRWILFLTLAAVILLVIWIFAESRGNDPTPFHFTAQALLFIFTFQATPFATGAIIGERESQTLDVLLTTPLSPRQIIVGKYLGCLRRLYFLPAILVGVFVVFGVATGRLHGIVLLHILLIHAAVAIFLTATGTCFSLLCKRSSVASTFNTVVGLSLWLLFPIFLAITRAILDANGMQNTLRRELEVLVDGAIIINPFAQISLAIEGASKSLASSLGSSPYILGGTQSHLSTTTYTLTLLAVLALASALAAAVLYLTVALFNRKTGRPS